MVVFFDIMYQDGVSYLELPYDLRRAKLEEVISPRPGYAILADRYQITSNQPLRRVEKLRNIFAFHISKFEEGVILKASESHYHDWQFPWVKV